MKESISIPRKCYTVNHNWKDFTNFPELGTRILITFAHDFEEAIVTSQSTIYVFCIKTTYTQLQLIHRGRKWTVITPEMEKTTLDHGGLLKLHGLRQMFQSLSRWIAKKSTKLMWVLTLYGLIALQIDIKNFFGF